MPNEVFEFLDGKHYVLDGVSGTFEHTCYTAIYPYTHKVESLCHHADSEGLKSRHYQETKRKLSDDWSSDLTTNIDRYCDIAVELSYLEYVGFRNIEVKLF